MRYVLGVLFGLATLAYATLYFWVDALIYSHLMYADYGDPDHPGRLKGVIVTGSQMLLDVAILLTLSFATWICFRRTHSSRSTTR